MTSPILVYQALIENGTLHDDPAQRAVAEALDSLAKGLRRYAPDRKRGWFQRSRATPRGLYIWGGVGVGKSLLMDLFVETAPIEKKSRVHFHAFMQEVHGFIAQWRDLSDGARRKHPARLVTASIDDPIPHAANAVFKSAHLFCFDEFHVTDITDAMLLGRLFETLFELGAVIVATSNRHPDMLYTDGINRQLFLPFIEELKTRLEIHELRGAKDYRLERLKNEPVYFTPLGADANEKMNTSWRAMTAGATARVEKLLVNGREISVPCAARGAARGTFDHWCRSTFGPADYLRLAANYPVIFVDQIPVLGPADRNTAKRFVTLIDAMYEARCTLFCSADAAPDSLYLDGDGAFEFGRTASRLNEMQSKEYLALAHTAEMDPSDAG